MALGRVELTAFTIAGDAVALDVTQMRAGRAQPLGLVEPDDPRLHHDAAVAPGGEPVAARELPARDIAARDAAAGQGTGVRKGGVEGKGGAVRVDLGVCRVIKKKHRDIILN